MGEVRAQRVSKAIAAQQVDQFFVDGGRGRERIEFTAYGSGDAWVVLVPPLLVPRVVHDRTARALAAGGLHVLVPDLLGHGRSDRPDDPLSYSVGVFADQVVALLDHVGAQQAVVGGSGFGANIALEVAVRDPSRVAGLLLDAPVLDHALAAQVAALVPMMYAARFAPFAVTGVRLASRAVPARVLPGVARLAKRTLDQRPGAVAAVLHGLVFGGFGPTARERRTISTPTLVLARPLDPFHPVGDAEAVAMEIQGAVLERTSALEWRRRPERLDLTVTRFARECLRPGIRRTRRA